MNKDQNISVQNAGRIQEISNSLDRITQEIFEINENLKTIEKSKEKLRSEFFSLANEYIRTTKTVDNQVLSIEFASRAEAEKHISNNYPGWVVVQYDSKNIVIEEDPEQMRFEWTTEDGYRMGRTTAIVGTKFDYEMLKDLKPEVFNQIVETKTVYEINEKKAQDLIESHPEYLDILQQSTRLGKIQLRMSSPKKVDDE